MSNTIIEVATNANELHDELIKGLDFSLPPIDWNDPEWKWPFDPDHPMYKGVEPLTNESLTTRQFGGTGTMDAIMESVYNHLDKEYAKGRFTKDDYVKAYIALTEASITNAVNFLVSRDGAYWDAIKAQIDAITGRTQLEAIRAQLMAQRVNVLGEEAKYANTKMNTLNQEVQYNSGEYSLENILPAQWVLVKEQGEVQRAQTLDERSDKLVVKGSIGKQKELYSQQIDSYKRDAEYKVGKFYVDAFTVMKTIDEGLKPPTEFESANITSVVQDVRKKAGL